MAPAFSTVNLAPSVHLPLAFFDRSTTAMALLREDGLLLYRNPAAERLFGTPQGLTDLVGRNILDWGPAGFASERIELMRELAAAGKDGLVRDIWAGEQILTHLRLLPAAPDERLRTFLTVHERAHGPLELREFPNVVFHDGQVQDLGPLALLSPRELEVLALVGQGLTAAQIAARIHRTEETVNTHKAALLRKLGCQNATQLALVAYRAGLKFQA
jgi:DNA-binding NarL/FixJ family response regulator